MIEKITIKYPDFDDLKDKINEIIELLNAITRDVDGTKCVDGSKEPDQYKSMTYMSDGHIKKFYGHDSIVELEVPLPQGTKITIRSITKGGDNE